MKTRRILGSILAVCVLLLLPRVDAADPQLPEFWVTDIDVPVRISEAHSALLMRSLAHRLLPQAARPDGKPPELPREVTISRTPHLVLLAVSDGTSAARVFTGAGRGLMAAVDAAVAQVQAVKDFTPRWLKLDIVRRGASEAKGALLGGFAFERSLYGMALDRRIGAIMTPEELVARTLINSKNRVQMGNVVEYFGPGTPRGRLIAKMGSDPDYRIYGFACQSMFWGDGEFHRLYRGHRRFLEIKREQLLPAAQAAGRYLTGAVGKDGRFAYSYLAKVDDERKQYNILRHAGTVYAMCQLHRVAPDKQLLEAAQRAAGYLLRQVQVHPEDPEMACVVERKAVKLGGNALAIVALVEMMKATGKRDHLPTARKLARWIISTQVQKGASQGRFLKHKRAWPSGEDLKHVSMYYPGEAILALLRLNDLDPRKEYVDAAERGVDDLVIRRDGNVDDYLLLPDQWLLYALDELHLVRPRKHHKEHAKRLATVMAGTQHLRPRYEDWAGGYDVPPRTCPAATRIEGMLAALRLARRTKQTKHAEQLLQASLNTTRFILGNQFYAESVMYLPNPQRALGGFHHGLSNFEVRIDYVQHSISALLMLHELMEDGERR
jgi:hypothetical protein